MQKEDRESLSWLLMRMSILPPRGSWGLTSIRRAATIGGMIDFLLRQEGLSEEEIPPIKASLREKTEESTFITLSKGILERERRPSLWRGKEMDRAWEGLCEYVVTGRGEEYIDTTHLLKGKRIEKQLITAALQQKFNRS